MMFILFAHYNDYETAGWKHIAASNDRQKLEDIQKRLSQELKQTRLIQNTLYAEIRKERQKHPIHQKLPSFEMTSDFQQWLDNEHKIGDACRVKATKTVLTQFGISDLSPYPEINAIEKQFGSLDFDFDIDDVREI